MGKIGNFITGIQAFLEEVRVELTKCNWPTRPELLESTGVVIISCLILATFVGVSDAALVQLLNLVIR